MIRFLLHIFAGRDTDPRNPAVRAMVGKISGAVGMACNVLLFVLKFVVGIMAGSVSIMADALNNLSDATSAIVTLLGFKLAERPADEHHPYGHARYEYLSGLAVAVIVIVIGFELAKTSVEKIFRPVPVEFSVLTALVLCACILVKLWLAVFNTKLGRMIDSRTLEATAADSRNDCLATGAVLIAGLVERFTGLQVDGYMGLGVALFILYSGWGLARNTISPLLGEATDPYLRRQIVDYIASNPKVLGYHDLMVHDYGPGQRFASLHVEMDKDEDPLVCHEIIDGMERECLKNQGIHLVIHYDPVVTDDPELDRMRALVTAILRMKDARMSIHDFRMIADSENIRLVFDVMMPMELQGQEETICAALEAALNDLGEKRYTTQITFDLETFRA